VPDSAKQDVKKTATVGMQVAVKGGDIFKDLGGAGMQSMGGVKSLLTMPTEILYRMKWATSGSLSFKVIDWDNSWKASGQVGKIVYSGVVCSLDQPFTIHGQNDTMVFEYKYIPTSPQAGNFTYSWNAVGVTWAGGGSYTVQGADTDKPVIMGQDSGTYTASAGSGSYNFAFQINLTPLDTNECSQP
jgi:hypothetical protein